MQTSMHGSVGFSAIQRRRFGFGRIFSFSLFAIMFAGAAISSSNLFAEDSSLTTYDIWNKGEKFTKKVDFLPFLPESIEKMEDQKSKCEATFQLYHQEYGLDEDLSTIRYLESRESLLGEHHYFQQYAGDTIIEGAQIICSISKKDQSIYRIYNTTYSDVGGLVEPDVEPLGFASQLYQNTWEALSVQGDLMNLPKYERKVISFEGTLRHVYQINISVTEPFGHWVVTVDAVTGKILEKRLESISRNPTHKEEVGPSLPEGLQAPKGSFLEAKKRFLLEQVGHSMGSAHGDSFVHFFDQPDDLDIPIDLPAENVEEVQMATGNGQGIVFDPDPRTTLMRSDLQDDSPAESFEEAYVTRELLGLDVAVNAAGVKTYHMSGPWVKVADFELPREAPSTTADGNWNAKRGNNAFNDAMTYFHLDQSQRYMQSLGFKDAKGIQHAPIHVDTNGVNGQDNSHFVPSSNKLAFGHGCVDDNEDADVILHEYGHAIHFSINNEWRGGDTGAMGEGFGDYWAGSYSITTKNGLDFEKNKVFSWDGHGTGAACWPGRIMDAMGAQYDPTKTYGAHERVGGFVSDELWSTPLFQSLLTLLEMGVPREEVDQLILEAHFGLGSSLKMREMAMIIVNTAARLHAGPHASVFRDNFLRHNIIEEPKPNFEVKELTLVDSGDNGVIDPGEDIVLEAQVLNSGTLEAVQVTAELSSPSEGVSITQAHGVYGDIAIGGVSQGENPYELHIDDAVACGSEVDFNLLFSVNGQENISHHMTYRLGSPVGFKEMTEVGQDIPDDSSAGLVNEIAIAVSNADAVVTQDFKVHMNIEHTYRGDLKIVLIAPSGRELLLHNRVGGSLDNVIGTYGVDLEPEESLEGLIGEPLNGTWKIKVSDNAGQDTGRLISWGIENIIGYECQ